MTDQTVRRRDPNRRWFYTAFVFAAIAVFANLGSEGIYAAQEGRTAIILRNMLRTGNCLEMNVKGGVPYEKPIGHYWLCLPSAYFAKLGGDAIRSKVEWGIRIPSALCSLLTVLLAGLLARRLYGTRTGAMTMVILATMSNFDKLGRLGHIDMPLAAAFTAAMYFLYTGYFEERKANWRIYLFYVALGWGMLLKGPLVLLLAALVVLGVSATRGKRWYEVPRDLRLVRGALIVLAIALPWYIYECIHSHGAFFREFIVRQNLLRFTGDAAVYHKSRPVWYYIPKLLAGALPWSLIGVAGVCVYFKRILKFDFSDRSRFLLIWFLTGFVFFSLAAVKRIDYLLPIFPALAIMIARAVGRWCAETPAVHRALWLTIWVAFAGLLLLLFVVNTSGMLVSLGQKIQTDKVPFFTEHDGMTIVMFSEFLIDHAMEVLEALAIALLLTFAIGSNMEKGLYNRAFGFAAVFVLGMFLAYHLAIEPGTDDRKTVRTFAEEARGLIGRHDGIIYFGDFNTELVYFMDQDDCRTEGLDKNADVSAADLSARFTEKDRWVIAPPFAAEKLRQAAPGAWRERLRTIENHQYPQVLLEHVSTAK